MSTTNDAPARGATPPPETRERFFPIIRVVRMPGQAVRVEMHDRMGEVVYVELGEVDAVATAADLLCCVTVNHGRPLLTVAHNGKVVPQQVVEIDPASGKPRLN